MKKAISIFSLSLVLFACKKETVNVPVTEPLPTTKPTVVGFWPGKYGVGSIDPSEGYAMLIRSNATLRVFNSTDTTTASKAEGIYTIENGILKGRYSYFNNGGNFSVTATLSADFKKLTGTWGSEFNSADGGAFYLNK